MKYENVKLLSREFKTTCGYKPDEYKFQSHETYTDGLRFQRIYSEDDILVTYVYSEPALMSRFDIIWVKERFKLSSVKNPLEHEKLLSLMKVAEEEKKLRKLKEAEDPWF